MLPTGDRLDRGLRELWQVSWGVVRRAIETGKVTVDGRPCRDPARVFAAGTRVEVRMAAPVAADHADHGDDALVVFADRAVVVARKPPGMATIPDARHPVGTLVQRLTARVRRGRQVPLGVVQRLDIETTGLLVFACTPRAEAALKTQLARRLMERSYLALVAGRAEARTHRSFLAEGRDGRRGSTGDDRRGKRAVTHVEVVESLAGATLVRCRLETGRTHQIRIHLSEAGHPLLGDRRYARQRVTMPPVLAPRVMLHAATLAFVHPVTGERLAFEAPMPADMAAVCDALRARS